MRLLMLYPFTELHSNVFIDIHLKTIFFLNRCCFMFNKVHSYSIHECQLLRQDSCSVMFSLLVMLKTVVGP